MQQVQCSACQTTVPMASTFVVQGHTLCEPCADKFVQEHHGTLQPGDVTRNVDPTVCGWCQKDSPEGWPLVCGIPACPPCEQFLRNRPYPTWIKASFAALVLLGIASFAYNYRFVDAFLESRRAEHALEVGDIEAAAGHMEQAAARVPDIEAFADEANSLRGMALVAADRSREALPKLQAAKAKQGGGDGLDLWILRAELAVAFEDKKYDVMLEKAEALAQLHPGHRFVHFGVASALACRYVETGNEQFKRDSLETLDAAAKLPLPAGASADENEDYRQRIMHRLETRTIITREEFAKKYPQGWKGEGGQ